MGTSVMKRMLSSITDFVKGSLDSESRVIKSSAEATLSSSSWMRSWSEGYFRMKRRVHKMVLEVVSEPV
jgi:hypothetical protein